MRAVEKRVAVRASPARAVIDAEMLPVRSGVAIDDVILRNEKPRTQMAANDRADAGLAGTVCRPRCTATWDILRTVACLLRFVNHRVGPVRWDFSSRMTL